MIYLSAFMEPKGFIKIFQFIFVICAFACTCDFRGDVVLTAKCPPSDVTAPPPAATSTTVVPLLDDTTALFEAIAEALADEAFDSTPEEPYLSSWQSDPASDQEEFELRDDASETTLEATGPDSLPETVRFTTTFQYAFKLEKDTAEGKNCNNTAVTMRLTGNYASPSSFYVFVGVSAMLYTLMAIALYTAFKEYYEQEWVPIVDLAVHFAYTIMWFAASVAWAVAVTAIKNETKISTIIDNNPSICYEDVDCSMNKIKWQLLDFSIVFGFLNFVLYLVNMWFIFKETTFYSKRTQATIS